MGVDEGFDDDEPDFTPPLPQEDRLWRHPAEVGASGALGTTARSGRNPWAVGFVSAIGGVLLAGSLMFGAGGVGQEPGRITLRPIATLAPLVTSAVGATNLVGQSDRPYLVGIDVAAPNAVRSGSGLVVRGDGRVLTTASLVESASDLRVTLADGSVHTGVVVGTDELNDLALLRIDATALTVAPIASPATVAIGDTAWIIGGARGSRAAAWTGPVTSLDGRVTFGACDLHGAVQINATVAANAAGGAVIDRSGAVIGLATTYGPDHAGSALAVPARTLKSVSDQLVATGTVHHGWLGVEGVNATSDDAVAAGGGAAVRNVIAGSPAAAAGLQSDDIIVTVGGEPVPNMNQLVLLVREHTAGSTVRVEYARSGTRQAVDVTLVEPTSI